MRNIIGKSCLLKVRKYKKERTHSSQIQVYCYALPFFSLLSKGLSLFYIDRPLDESPVERVAGPRPFAAISPHPSPIVHPHHRPS